MKISGNEMGEFLRANGVPPEVSVRATPTADGGLRVRADISFHSIIDLAPESVLDSRFYVELGNAAEHALKGLRQHIAEVLETWRSF